MINFHHANKTQHAISSNTQKSLVNRQNRHQILILMYSMVNCVPNI